MLAKEINAHSNFHLPGWKVLLGNQELLLGYAEKAVPAVAVKPPKTQAATKGRAVRKQPTLLQTVSSSPQKRKAKEKSRILKYTRYSLLLCIFYRFWWSVTVLMMNQAALFAAVA